MTLSDNDRKKDRVCWNIHYNDMVAFLDTFSVSSFLLTVYTRLYSSLWKQYLLLYYICFVFFYFPKLFYIGDYKTRSNWGKCPFLEWLGFRTINIDLPQIWHIQGCWKKNRLIALFEIIGNSVLKYRVQKSFRLVVYYSNKEYFW